MDNYTPLFDEEPVSISDLEVGRPVAALQSAYAKSPVPTPAAMPEGWKIVDDDETTPEKIEETNLSAEYDKQAAGFKSPSKPTEPAEPSFFNPPPGKSRVGYAWDKLGELFADNAAPQAAMVAPQPEVPEAAQVPVPETPDPPNSKDSNDTFLGRALNRNPSAPKPYTEVVPEDLVNEEPGAIVNGINKVVEFRDMYTGKLGAKLQKMVANDWNRASTHIAETYLKPPKFDDMVDAQNYYVNNAVDDIASSLISLVGGSINIAGNIPMFTGAGTVATADAAWQLAKNINEDEWKLEESELANAASHGGALFNKLFEKYGVAPFTPGQAEVIERFPPIFLFNQFFETAEAFGEENDWSRPEIEALKFGGIAAAIISPVGKTLVKGLPKTTAKMVDAIHAKFGKPTAITPEEASFYVDNFKKATKLTNQQRFENMMKSADDSARGTLRNQVELLGIEDLEAYKDGTLGGRFEAVTAQASKDARLAEAAKAVDSTMGSVRNGVDHILNNHGVVAEALMKKGKHEEAAKYFNTLDEEIAKARKSKGFKTETTPEQKARITALRKLKKENDVKRAAAVAELEAEIPEVEAAEEVPEVTPLVEPKSTDLFTADKSAEEVFASVAARLEAKAKSLSLTTTVQNAQKPAKRKTVKKSKTVPEVETVNTALTHEMFKDKETTLSEAEILNDPEVQHSVSISPVASMRKLVNDVNRYLHGDKGVDINLIADSLNNMHQEVNGYRGAFAKQEYFNEFYHEVNKAAEFADLAKWNEIDPKIGRPSETPSGITLSSGFDPSLVKSTLQEGIELSKKLVGAMKPSAARKFVAELGKTRELELSGLDAFLAQAERDGRKVTKEDLLQNMKPLGLEMEVNRTSYADASRTFPKNTGYEGHIYKYGVEDTFFNATPGIYASHGSNQVFNTRISRVLDESGKLKAYALEEFQSDWWQKGAKKEGATITDIPFKDNWEKNALGIEMLQAIAEGAEEFHVPTGETVLRKGGVLNENQSVKVALDSAGTSEYRKSTIRAITSMYDNGVPKWIRQLMSRWGEKAEIKLVPGDRAYWRVKLPDSLHKKVQEKQVVPTVKLSSGLDPADIVKEFTGTAKQMQGWFNHLRSQKDVPKTKRIADLSAKLQSDWIDTKAYAKKMLDQLDTKESYDAFKQLVLSSGSQTAGAMAVKRARQAIYKGTNKLRREMVDNVIFVRRIIAIDEARAQEAIRTGVHKPVKHPKLSKERAQELGFPEAVELDSKVAKQYLDQLERRLDPADFADVVRRSEIYFNVMRDQLKMLKDKGVISPQLYGRLVKWDYSKRQDIMDKLDPEVTHMIGREPITVRESGVVRLREGTNEDLLEIDSELLMADIVQAAHNRVFRNDTNLALRDIAVKSPDNGLVRIPKTDKASPPRGWSSVELFIDGKQQKLFLENDFARSWLVRNREVSFEIARRNQAWSGSVILKPMATGINPEFAFANIFRDLAHIWLTSQVKVGDKWVSPYSKHLPLAIPQMAGDLAKVAHDTFTRRGRWIDAVQDGMGMQFLSHEGRVWRKHENIQSNLDLIQEAVGYLNESSEILSRLMVRERAMKNYAKRVGVDFKEFERLNELLRPEWKDGKMVEKPEAKKIDAATRKLVQEIRNEGSFIGRDYMDFSVHGSKGEYADTLIPYLNPGIQGTRGLFRAARRNKEEFATKLAYVTATTMTLYFMNRSNNEDGMKHISKQARLNNFIIMTNTKIKDANGVERYVYYTIPKDPSQRYFTHMIEKFMDKFVYGEEVDWPSITETVGSLFPISPDNVLGITPTGNALLAAYGIDSWRTMLNKSPVAIWREGELPDDQQGEAYIAGRGQSDTPQWAITLGKQFNMKPVEIEQIMGSCVTHTGNLWTWASGKVFDQVFTDDADEARQEMFGDLMSQYEKQNNLPLFRRFIGLTTSDTEQALEQDEDIIKEHTLNNWMLERKLNIAAQNYILGRGDLGDINALKADYPDSHKKIDEEIESVTTIMNPDLVSPSNRSFWQSMRKPGSNAEKAERYFARYQAAKEPDQLELERIILGYNTPDFLQEYARVLVDAEK